MTLLGWIGTTLSSATVVALAAALLKDAITTRLMRSVQHEFDEKLAEISSALRKGEERLRADLNKKQAEITGLQNAILSGRAGRMAALDKRRQEAVDEIWLAVHLLGFAKGAATTMSVVKFEALLSEAEKNPKARELVAHLNLDMKNVEEPFRLSERARPFLSELTWAYFTAYQRILLHSVARAHLIRVGLNMPHLMDDDKLLNLLRVTLPAYSDYIKQHGLAATYHLLEPLEGLLLHELRQMMEGQDTDLKEVQRAKEIMLAANNLGEETTVGRSS